MGLFGRDKKETNSVAIKETGCQVLERNNKQNIKDL